MIKQTTRTTTTKLLTMIATIRSQDRLWAGLLVGGGRVGEDPIGIGELSPGIVIRWAHDGQLISMPAPAASTTRWLPHCGHANLISFIVQYSCYLI